MPSRKIGGFYASEGECGNGEDRFDHLLTLTFTPTLAAPVVTIAIAGAENQPNLLHWQGGVALVLFVATAMSGIVIRQHGELTFMNIDGMMVCISNVGQALRRVILQKVALPTWNPTPPCNVLNWPCLDAPQSC